MTAEILTAVQGEEVHYIDNVAMGSSSSLFNVL